jgi:uncharacterized sulfatase
MRRTLFTLMLAAGCAVLCGAGRPNVVAIVTDDQGQWAVGAYGNRDCQTPHLDRISREGALFPNAFTCTPVCSPSRASYFSGRYPTEVKITDFLNPAEQQQGLGLHQPIWPAVLQQHGYKTGLFGKWHLGTQSEFHPVKKGFDGFYGFLGGGTSPMNPTFDHSGQPQKVPGPVPDLITTAALEFIDRHQAQPFLVCLHFREPHLPYGPVPEEDSAPFADLDPAVPDVPGADRDQLKKWHRDYYASIHALDRNVGRLLKKLDDLKLADNTWVIFTSDHGYNNGRHGVETKGNGQWIAGGVRGPKRPNMWDTSLKVPLLMRWPGVIEPGRQINDVVTNLDMYRTVLGALQLPVPEGVLIHGNDYSPLLRGRLLPLPDRFFGQYDLHNGGLAYMRMVRNRQYKYVRHFKANQMDELYDLRDDPDETKNLANAPRLEAVRAELSAQIQKWMESIDDPLLKSTY